MNTLKKYLLDLNLSRYLTAHRVKSLVRLFVTLFFRPKIIGLENLMTLVGPAVLLSNRTSFLDAAMLAALSPRPLTVVVPEGEGGLFWIRAISRFVRVLAINYEKAPGANLDEALENDQLVLIFPEIHITPDGNLVRFSDELSYWIKGRGQAIMPVFIQGPEFSLFGKLRKHIIHLPRKKPVTVRFFPQTLLDFSPRADEKRKERIVRASLELYNFMLDYRFKSMDYHKNLWDVLTSVSHCHGPFRKILEDVERKPLSYHALIRKARYYAHRFEELTTPGEYVGLLLPGSANLVLSMFGLWFCGRVAVFLNYSQGPVLMSSALKTAKVKTIISSRRFLEESGLDKVYGNIEAKIVYLEDLTVSFSEKIAAILQPARCAPPDSPAAVLFTSGSEGRPKGVVHSHESLLAHNYMWVTHMEHNGDDIFFNPLPSFHAMGLNLLLLLPLTCGMRVFLYPSPLHAHNIPRLIYELGATVMATSDTFANAWAREAHGNDFSTVRIFLAGSEKIKTKTHERFFREFGVRILEGYGVTEVSPVISVNTRMNYRLGSIGHLVNGLLAKVEPVEGINEGGVLYVKGPNVMMGYLHPDQPGTILPPQDGWHNTGDIVELDEDGFIFIKGRYKRFAKIGGEMISLSIIEEVVNQIWPGIHAVVAVEDEVKGEKLILVTADEAPDLNRLRVAIKESGLAENCAPKQKLLLPEMPVTPVGKLDMPKLLEIVREKICA